MSTNRVLNKISRLIIPLIYALAIVLLLIAGTQWLLNSSYFPVKYNKIESKQQGFKRLDAVYLQEVARKSITGNIFSVNLNQVKTQFEQIPWVKNVETRRVWPDTIVVQIEERVPVARWQSTELIDNEGNLFTAPNDETLPLLDGPKLSEKKLLKIYQETEQQIRKINLQVAELICSERLSCNVKLSNGLEVKLGKGNINERMERFVYFWSSILKPQIDNLEYVDMRYQNAFAIKPRAVSVTNP